MRATLEQSTQQIELLRSTGSRYQNGIEDLEHKIKDDNERHLKEIDRLTGQFKQQHEGWEEELRRTYQENSGLRDELTSTLEYLRNTRVNQNGVSDRGIQAIVEKLSNMHDFRRWLKDKDLVKIARTYKFEHITHDICRVLDGAHQGMKSTAVKKVLLFDLAVFERELSNYRDTIPGAFSHILAASRYLELLEGLVGEQALLKKREVLNHLGWKCHRFMQITPDPELKRWGLQQAVGYYERGITLGNLSYMEYRHLAVSLAEEAFMSDPEEAVSLLTDSYENVRHFMNAAEIGYIKERVCSESLEHSMRRIQHLFGEVFDFTSQKSLRKYTPLKGIKNRFRSLHDTDFPVLEKKLNLFDDVVDRRYHKHF